MEFERALELDPSYAWGHLWYALHRIANKDDAVEHAQRARDLDPLSVVIGSSMGMILLYSREYDRSIETLREMLKLDPGYRGAQVTLVRAYAVKGMHNEAVEVAERLVPTNPVTLAAAYAGAGRREDALRILEEAQKSPIRPTDVAQVYAALGDTEAALVWLEKAYERRSLGLTWGVADPFLDPIRSDPRFQDLLRRIGSPAS